MEKEKEKRADKNRVGFYGAISAYLYFTVYENIAGIVKGEVESGRDIALSILFAVIFAAGATWLAYTSWKMHKQIKQQEEAEGEKTVQKQQSASIASRAMAYQNPADEEEKESGEAASDSETTSPE